MCNKYISKYENELMLVSAIVSEIIESNTECKNGNTKNVFKCESCKNPDGQLCIFWGRTTICSGDKIQMKGRYKDDVFLVWDMFITQKFRGA